MFSGNIKRTVVQTKGNVNAKVKLPREEIKLHDKSRPPKNFLLLHWEKGSLFKYIAYLPTRTTGTHCATHPPPIPFRVFP